MKKICTGKYKKIIMAYDWVNDKNQHYIDEFDIIYDETQDKFKVWLALPRKGDSVIDLPKESADEIRRCCGEYGLEDMVIDAVIHYTTSGSIMKKTPRAETFNIKNINVIVQFTGPGGERCDMVLPEDVSYEIYDFMSDEINEKEAWEPRYREEPEYTGEENL
ncbi:MAG: hypothetical protein ACOC5T_04890 [Elusimicrobiota bacterium]